MRQPARRHSIPAATATAARIGAKYVYDFAEGSREMRNLLGGKGANICEMTRLLGADLVPAGFVDHHRGVRRAT